MIEPTTEDRPHAKHSSSQLKYLAICAGYRPRKNKVEHWVTQQGNRGHKAMEHDDLDPLQSDYEVKLVQLCKDYEATLRPAFHEEVEKKIVTILDRWGYTDKIRHLREGGIESNGWMIATKLDLVDYKFVRKEEVTDAEANLQGYDYVIGLFDEYPLVTEITAHFVMPRFGSVTTAKFTRDQLPELRLKVFAIVTQARRTDRKRAAACLFRPDFDVCRYCANTRCPAIFKIAREVAEKYVGHPIPEVPENVHPSDAKDPKTLGAIKAIASILETWVESANHHVTETAVHEGIKPEGYVVDYQNGQRKITDPLALMLVAPKYKVTTQDIVASSRVSINRLEEIVMANAPHGQKGHTKSAFLDELRDHNAIDRSEDRPYLRKISPGETAGDQQPTQ